MGLRTFLCGLKATRQLRALAPRARVVMLSSLENVALRRAASAAGARGYVSQCAMRTTLIPVIDAMDALLGANREGEARGTV